MDIKFPFGNADAQVLSATGAQALTITDNLTILDGVTTEATGNRTLNLAVAGVQTGAMIFIKSKTNATETLIFGTGMLGTTLTGVAGKTFGMIFIFDGTNFVEAGTPVQVD